MYVNHSTYDSNITCTSFLWHDLRHDGLRLEQSIQQMQNMVPHIDDDHDNKATCITANPHGTMRNLSVRDGAADGIHNKAPQ